MRTVSTIVASHAITKSGRVLLEVATRRQLPMALGCLLVAATTAASAELVVIDFQDLAPPAQFEKVPDLYQGLFWGSSSWFYGELDSDPGQIYAALGSANAAISGINGADFFFDGADYWSRRVADANGDFYFVLYHDGQQVYDGRNDQDGRQRFDENPQRFVPNYTGPVDYVALAFDGGGDDWDHLAMDNMQIRTIVPSPGALALLSLGGLLAATRRPRPWRVAAPAMRRED